MKRFLIKLTILTGLWILLLSAFLWGVNRLVQQRDFANHTTESNLLVIKDSCTYDLLFLRISHARNFSRHGNHQRVESVLNKFMINLGQWVVTCGVRELFFIWIIFFIVGITFKQLLPVDPSIIILGNSSHSF